MSKPDETLHILVRTDMLSLNPGKAMAQAAHAANQAHYAYSNGEFRDAHAAAFERWLNQGDGFGTTYVWNGQSDKNIKMLLPEREITGLARETEGGLVIDGSYPLKDGETTHIINGILTCAWIFSPFKTSLGDRLKNLTLHP